MDMSIFAQTPTFDLQILHPVTGDELGLLVTIIGADSAEYSSFSDLQERNRAKRMVRNGKYNPDAITPDSLRKDNLDLLVFSTRNLSMADGSALLVNGESVPFNNDSVRMLYTNYPWLAKQVQEAIADRANFFVKQASSS